MFEKTNTDNFMNRKISIWHFVYVILFCIMFAIVTLVLIPGRVSDEAYQNFSFAATITSIVLALVSIVYSLQSGLSSVGQLHSVIQIESQISNEIKKFTGIDEKIRNALEPISSQVGDIKNAQDDMRQAQDNMKQAQDDYHNELIKKLQLEIPKDEGGNIKLEGPAILYILLYAAAKSKETKKDIPYHLFGKHVGWQSRYYEGLLDGMAVLHPQQLKIEQGDRPSKKIVTEFDETVFGNISFLRGKITSLPKHKLFSDWLEKLDTYFNDVSPQLPPTGGEQI